MGSSDKWSSDVSDSELSTYAEYDNNSWDQTFIEGLTEQTLETDMQERENFPLH